MHCLAWHLYAIAAQPPEISQRNKSPVSGEPPLTISILMKTGKLTIFSSDSCDSCSPTCSCLLIPHVMICSLFFSCDAKTLLFWKKLHVWVCCFIENLLGRTSKQTIVREMEVAQNEVYLKRGDLGDILKAFGLGCTLQERKQRLRAKTWLRR